MIKRERGKERLSSTECFESEAWFGWEWKLQVVKVVVGDVVGGGGGGWGAWTWRREKGGWVSEVKVKIYDVSIL